MSSVSVIVPCYNYAHFLRECAESVLSQTGVDVRLLVIDDASSDNTAEVASELAAHHPNMEFRQHKTNCGHIATYNEGLASARGDYTVLLSADDLLTSGALQRAAQLMDSHPEVGFVYGGCVWFTTGQPKPQPRIPPASSIWKLYDGLDWLKIICQTGYSFIVSPEVVVRTSLQHQLGGYLPALTHTGDLEMWMRFAAHAAVGQILDADQAFYRMHGNNMHNSVMSAAYKDVQQRKAAYDRIFQDYKDVIPGWEKLQKIADRSLASDAILAICQAYYRRQVSQTPVKELLSYVTNSYQGNFFSLDFLRVYFNVINRIASSLRKKLGASFSQA